MNHLENQAASVFGKVFLQGRFSMIKRELINKHENTFNTGICNHLFGFLQKA